MRISKGAAAEIDTLAFHVVECGADPQCRQTSIVSMGAWQQSKRADARHPSHCSQNSTRLEAAAATKLQRIAKIANIDGADCGSANSFHAMRVRGEPKVSTLSRSPAEWTSQPGRRRSSKKGQCCPDALTAHRLHPSQSAVCRSPAHPLRPPFIGGSALRPYPCVPSALSPSRSPLEPHLLLHRHSSLIAITSSLHLYLSDPTHASTFPDQPPHWLHPTLAVPTPFNPPPWRVHRTAPHARPQCPLRGPPPTPSTEAHPPAMKVSRVDSTYMHASPLLTSPLLAMTQSPKRYTALSCSRR